MAIKTIATSAILVGLLSLARPALGAPTGRLAPKERFQVLLFSPESVDALTMDCASVDGDSTLRELSCRFRQILVSRKERPAEELEKERTELRASVQTAASLKEMLATCGKSLKFTNEIRKLTSNKYKLAAVDADLAFLTRMCACKTGDCVADALIESQRRKEATCSIMGVQFAAQFTRQTQNRWVSVSGPQGLCDIVLTLIIEYDAQGDSWKFTQKRLATAPPSELCAESIENTSVAFSHYRYAHDAEINCGIINSILP